MKRFVLSVATYSNVDIFLGIGVIVYCGMEKVSINYLMSVENQGFRITSLFMAYFLLRLRQVMEG